MPQKSISSLRSRINNEKMKIWLLHCLLALIRVITVSNRKNRTLLCFLSWDPCLVHSIIFFTFYYWCCEVNQPSVDCMWWNQMFSFIYLIFKSYFLHSFWTHFCCWDVALLLDDRLGFVFFSSLKSKFCHEDRHFSVFEWKIFSPYF